jgi:prevent-host-death family protein
MMRTNTWQLQVAKSKFSQLVKNARQQGPQIVTKHGKEAVVVISFEEYKRIMKPQTDLVTFLRNSPLANIELEVTRDKGLPRDITL